MRLPSEATREQRLYVEDMLEFCERALRYADGQPLQALLTDTMRYDAILRNIELIGEAATHLGPAERALGPEIPWRQIVGTRNRVAHGYLGISPDTVWDILTVELPALRPLLLELNQRMSSRAAPAG
jgi:uncharacterized protein with HEPN domain